MALAALPILTYQTPTHALLIDLPAVAVASGKTRALGAVRHRVGLTEYAVITWNGRPVTFAELVKALNSANAAPRASTVIFQPDGNATYELSLQVLAVLDEHIGPSNLFCFGGLSQYSNLGLPQNPGASLPMHTSVWIDENAALKRPDDGETLEDCEAAPGQLLRLDPFNDPPAPPA